MTVEQMFNALPKPIQNTLRDLGLEKNETQVSAAYAGLEKRKEERKEGSAAYQARANGPITIRLNDAQAAGERKNRFGKLVKRPALPAGRFLNIDGLGTSAGASMDKEGALKLLAWLKVKTNVVKFEAMVNEMVD